MLIGYIAYICEKYFTNQDYIICHDDEDDDDDDGTDVFSGPFIQWNPTITHLRCYCL